MKAEKRDLEKAYKLALKHSPNIDRDDFMGKLSKAEIPWVNLQPFLFMRGYQLRARYRPGWTPSWFNSKKAITNLYDFEDALALGRSTLMDATRIYDGAKVVIKRIDTSTEEIPIIQYLNSPELLADSKNHTVPLLDVILMPDDDTQALVVMPQLLDFHVLPFRRVGEVLEAICQYLEGLQFMHDHNISHRDACYFNLMMDGSKVVPRGFHFMRETRHDGVTETFKWRERWSVRPVQYYFIDFGISRRYPAEQKNVTDNTRLGQDKSVPEYSLPYPYDPYKADIYQLGNVFLKVIQKYDPEGLEPFVALGKAMTSPNPQDRPSPVTALRMLDGLDEVTLRRRIWRPTRTSRDKFKIRFCGWTPVV